MTRDELGAKVDFLRENLDALVRTTIESRLGIYPPARNGPGQRVPSSSSW